ncbi:MAG TPA: ATP-dependent Clp protease ATP-binding subunit [Candidatus Saccharimonadales bacterium]|nr:ATP-dependent Clp protease ATP-binding subunit [Candidatus Saccharimonadales bacterium]
MFDYHSRRAVEARFGAQLRPSIIVSLRVAAIVLILCGLLLLGFAEPIGWLALTLAAWPYCTLVWQRRHLSRLPVEIGDRLDQQLEASVLAALPRDLSAKALATATMQSNGGRFMAVRLGLAPNFLTDLSSEASQSVEAIWQKARQLAGKGQVSGAHLVAALVSVQNGFKNILPHLQLDEADVANGAGWYDHLDRLILDHQKPKRTGGLARDWTFGYTPLLERFAANVSRQVEGGSLLSVDLEAHKLALERLQQTFVGGGRQNIALVGPLGVGKTSLVYAFAEKLMNPSVDLPANLRFHQVVNLDAGSLIGSAKGRGDLEELVNALLIEAYRAKNIIVCLDGAELFFEDGVGSVDLSNVLLPVIEGGNLRMILTMEEQRWLKIAARNPALANALNRVGVEPTNRDETMLVMQDQLISYEFKHKVTYMYQALQEAYRLSERYMYDQAQPGKSLKLLESAADYAESGLVTAGSVQRAVEQGQGVKIGATSDAGEKQKLLQLEDLIHERMINQTRAVGVVSDALRRARAGVRNENKPIGTFLFLGPTGVGKTELARSLAAVYFGGEDRLIRLDMNEFVAPDDVKRLIADGAADEHSLTAQVMKQPFSVILLDELEKAHDAVLTTLLQVLDEGVLRDIKGREVSFRDAIFIATSNAGADQIRHHIDSGEKLEDFEDLLTDELISSKQFRPEFLNRFDEIVLFRPLDKKELLQVIDLIITGINKTMAHQKVRLTVDDEAKTKLVDLGYDPRLGARPLRRVVQRTVESVMAKKLLAGEAQAGDTIVITVDDIKSDK